MCVVGQGLAFVHTIWQPVSRYHSVQKSADEVKATCKNKTPYWNVTLFCKGPAFFECGMLLNERDMAADWKHLWTQN